MVVSKRGMVILYKCSFYLYYTDDFRIVHQSHEVHVKTFRDPVHGCTVTGEKVKVDGIIVTLNNADRHKVEESLSASRIEGDILMLADFQGTTKTKFLEEILGLKYHAPPTADNDETDGDQARTDELQGSLTFGESRSDNCSIMLTGLAKRILLQKVTRGKKISSVSSAWKRKQ